MSPRTPSLLAGLGLAALLTGVLAGCVTGSGGTPTAPAGPSDDVSEQEVGAAWLDGGRMIGLVTQGSSTCVPTADEATLEGSVLKVTLVDVEGDTPCTADLAPRVTPVDLPDGVDPQQGLEIEVSGDGWTGDTELEGVPGLTGDGETDYLPTAGWTDVDGQFVILSWGSSSCAPTVEAVTASGPAEVAVTFATPPADQVCTMDMAPRAVVVAVTGVEDEDAEVFAVLTGAEFDNVRIPIVAN